MGWFVYLHLLLSFLPVSVSTGNYSAEATVFIGIDLQNPVIELPAYPHSGYASSRNGSEEVFLCNRVQVSGMSRLSLWSYANSFKITLAPSVVIPEKPHSQIQICFHRNASLGLCHCESDKWETVQKGLWNSVMSPYEVKYLDVKLNSNITSSVIITEDFHGWRLIWLVVGLVLMLLAPVVSRWVRFFYSSFMAIGVFFVLVFQGMKRLTRGTDSVLHHFFDLPLYKFLVRVGSFLFKLACWYFFACFSLLSSFIFVNFMLTEKRPNPVSVFLLLGIILAGAALWFWIVWKFVKSNDEGMDVVIAHFAKWAMRAISSAFIFQSTLDTPLAFGALACSFCIGLFITYFEWELVSSWSVSLVKGLISFLNGRGRKTQCEYFSTFHNMPNKKQFTEKE